MGGGGGRGGNAVRGNSGGGARGVRTAAHLVSLPKGALSQLAQNVDLINPYRPDVLVVGKDGRKGSAGIAVAGICSGQGMLARALHPARTRAP